jgi:ribosomal protein S18 acetylase RimI-like enzyme
MHHPSSITLRAATLADRQFLRELYQSTREPELEAAGWDASQREAFINMQFDIQRRAYASSYPNARHQIILLDDEPIGRILKNESEDEFMLVDIALLPPYRKQGIGTHLIEELLAEAIATAKLVRLHVLKTNPAIRLYQRLGFSEVADDGVYLEMEWLPKRC